MRLHPHVCGNTATMILMTDPKIQVAQHVFRVPLLPEPCVQYALLPSFGPTVLAARLPHVTFIVSASLL